MFYEFFVSYLTLVIDFLKDRGSEEQILRALTYQFKERSLGFIEAISCTIREAGRSACQIQLSLSSSMFLVIFASIGL